MSFHLSHLDIILIISTLLEFNPLSQVFKSLRSGAAKDVSMLTFISIALIGALWLYYGITIKSIPLIIGNAIKLFTAFMVVVICFKQQSLGQNEQ